MGMALEMRHSDTNGPLTKKENEFYFATSPEAYMSRAIKILVITCNIQHPINRIEKELGSWI